MLKLTYLWYVQILYLNELMVLNFISPFHLCVVDVNTSSFVEAADFFIINKSWLQDLAIDIDPPAPY